MKTRILTIAIICLLIVSFSVNVFSVSETIIEETVNNITVEENIVENKTLEEQKQEVTGKIDETNTKLEYVQGEITENVRKIAELDDSIVEYQAKYSQLMIQIDALEKNINETNIRLEQVQAQYDKKQVILKKRVVALYEAGDTSYIDILLSSKNVTEFLSNYFFVGELIEYDNNLLDELEDTRNRMQATKYQQEKQENELRANKQEINQTKILMENKQILKQNYMIKLTAEERELQQQIEQYKAEQREIENKILAAVTWNGEMAIQYTGGAMIWPVAMQGTHITSGFGMRLHPIQGIYKGHAGIDISGPNINGAPAVAVADGIVTYAGWMGGYGNCVIVNHGNGIATLYGHGLEIVTEIGKEVKQGDTILKVGSTGNSTGPHLHFEVRENGVAVNPMKYLDGTVTSINPQQTNTIVENVEVNTNTISDTATNTTNEVSNEINNTTY